MTVSRLELAKISATSPSLAETMRACQLRAGISRARGVSSFVLGNPKAWLGTAYHAVLEGAAGGGAAATHEAVWAAAVDQQHFRARQHPLDRRFGAPERWPGYHLVRAMALLRAQEFGGGVSQGAGHRGTQERRAAAPELWLSGAKARLVGRPDLVRGNAVIDYKTGEIHEPGDGSAMKASHVRQLQVYAFLVKESTGAWPVRGVLLPMEGAPLEIELESAACERAAAEALSLLDEYNRNIEAAGPPASLGNASPTACKWCPYQVLCPAFWPVAGNLSADQIGGAAIGGTALAVPTPIHGGAALALSLDSNEGTEPPGEVTLAPLISDVHTCLAQVQPGISMRVSGLARRADGTVVPTVRTLVARRSDLPAIVCRHGRESPKDD